MNSLTSACRGRAFAASVPPARFLLLSQAIDLHRVDPGAVTTPTTVVAVEEDRLVPFHQLTQLADALGGPARLVTLSSPFGHDAFLKEIDAIGGVVRTALDADGGDL